MKKMKIFSPNFKKTIGYILIAFLLALTIKIVKFLPLFVKIGIIGIDFALFYFIFTELIQKKSK